MAGRTGRRTGAAIRRRRRKGADNVSSFEARFFFLCLFFYNDANQYSFLTMFAGEREGAS